VKSMNQKSRRGQQKRSSKLPLNRLRRRRRNRFFDWKLFDEKDSLSSIEKRAHLSTKRREIEKVAIYEIDFLSYQLMNIGGGFLCSVTGK
jgi:hypothetical protein